jgi:hypothetical protein
MPIKHPRLITISLHATYYAVVVDNTAFYFSGVPQAPDSTAGNAKYYFPVNGKIKEILVQSYSSTAGTNEAWKMGIRINNTTDYDIQEITVANSFRRWINQSLNIPVTTSDYFEFKSFAVTWATNPANTKFYSTIIIEIP